MNICPAGIDSKKPNFLLKNRFIVSLICRGLAPKIMNMLGVSLERVRDQKPRRISRFILKNGCNITRICLRGF